MNPVMAGDLGIGDGYPPRIMGVLNISEESPYDPSVFTDATAAATYIDETLISAGADIVDIGLASANKRFDVLSAEEELARLDTAIEAIDRASGDAVFSIETRYASVADTALEHGFHLVNDICGFADPAMPEICEKHGVPAVKMAGPGDLERPGAIAAVDDIFDALLAEPLTEQTIIDPAFGGWSEDKDLAADQETFDRLREFAAIDRPLLVSINRKNFLRKPLGRSTEEALPVSLAATSLAVERGADIIRTHDVAKTKDAAMIGHAFRDTKETLTNDGIRVLPVNNERELKRHLERIGAGKASAADGITKVIELGNLNQIDRTLIINIAQDVGAHAVEGRKDAPLLVLGTSRALRNFQDRLEAESPDISNSLAIVLERS